MRRNITVIGKTSYDAATLSLKIDGQTFDVIETGTYSVASYKRVVFLGTAAPATAPTPSPTTAPTTSSPTAAAGPAAESSSTTNKCESLADTSCFPFSASIATIATVGAVLIY
jgi:hypothetical protein